MGNAGGLVLGVIAFLYFASMLKWQTKDTKTGLMVGLIVGILIATGTWLWSKDLNFVLIAIFFGGLFVGILSIIVQSKFMNKPEELARQLGQGFIVGSWSVMMILKFGYLFV